MYELNEESRPMSLATPCKQRVRLPLRQRCCYSSPSQPSSDEIINALKAMKAWKAAGPDGILSEMLNNIGSAAIRWLQVFYDDVVTIANI